MLLFVLCPRRRYRPHFALEVQFIPRGQSHLPGARGSLNQKSKGGGGNVVINLFEPRHDARSLGIGHGGVMLPLHLRCAEQFLQMPGPPRRIWLGPIWEAMAYPKIRSTRFPFSLQSRGAYSRNHSSTASPEYAGPRLQQPASVRFQEGHTSRPWCATARCVGFFPRSVGLRSFQYSANTSANVFRFTSSARSRALASRSTCRAASGFKPLCKSRRIS